MSEFKTNVMRILDKNKITYSVHTYEADESIDGISVAAKIGKSNEVVFKTLVNKGKKDYYIFVIPVEKELDLKKAAKSVDEKSVDMIPVKDINKVTGYIRGGCSPVGMKKQYCTVIDNSALLLDKFVVSAGKIGYQIEVSPKSISILISADFYDLTL